MNNQMIGATLLWCLALPGLADAQLADPNQRGVAVGHMHLSAQDVPAAAQFYLKLGGTAMTPDRIKFPGVVIMLRQAAPTGPSAGSSVDHFTFSVPNAKDALARFGAAGLKTGDSYVLTPDGLIRIELVQDERQREPIKFNAVNFSLPEKSVAEVQRWYTETFGAAPRQGRSAVSDVPGGMLSFGAVPGSVAPTQGRAIDHIGFEIVGLEAFAKNLEAKGQKFDRPYSKGNTLMLAFITDPWGTTIELTEGLRNMAAASSPAGK